jgi:hypothetical protein
MAVIPVLFSDDNIRDEELAWTCTPHSAEASRDYPKTVPRLPLVSAQVDNARTVITETVFINVNAASDQDVSVSLGDGEFVRLEIDID